MTEYITMQEYKGWAGLTSPNQDPQIAPLIPAACEAVQEYIGYTINPLDVDGNPISTDKVFRYMFKSRYDNEILLPSWNSKPSAAALVMRHNPNIVVRTLEDYNYYIDELTGKLTLTTEIQEGLGLAVTYTETNEATDSIKLATYMLIDYWKEQDFQVVKSQSGQSVTSTPVRVLPSHIESLLDSYRGM